MLGSGDMDSVYWKDRVQTNQAVTLMKCQKVGGAMRVTCEKKENQESKKIKGVARKQEIDKQIQLCAQARVYMYRRRRTRLWG